MKLKHILISVGVVLHCPIILMFSTAIYKGFNFYCTIREMGNLYYCIRGMLSSATFDIAMRALLKLKRYTGGRGHDLATLEPTPCVSLPHKYTRLPCVKSTDVVYRIILCVY